MLKGLDPLLSPELLSTLRAMGHGDEIAIVDGNYPGVEHARRLIRLDGHGLIPVLDAVLSVLPIVNIFMLCWVGYVIFEENCNVALVPRRDTKNMR